MAMAAGIVQADLPAGKRTIAMELAGKTGVNGDDVGGHITHEPLGIS